MSYWDDDEISETEKAYRYYSRVCPWNVRELLEAGGYIDGMGNPIMDELLPEHGYPTGEQI